VGKRVVLIGTLDTKGVEFAYVRDRLQALGLETTVVDVGILGEPLGIEPDIDHAEVARYGGTTIEALQTAGSRGRAVAGMRDAVLALVRQLYRDGELDAIFGMGGAEGAVMGAAAKIDRAIGRGALRCVGELRPSARAQSPASLVRHRLRVVSPEMPPGWLLPLRQAHGAPPEWRDSHCHWLPGPPSGPPP